MTSRVFAGVAVSVAVLAAGAVPVLTQSPPAMARYGRFGIDLTSQNASVKPGDDLVNGTLGEAVGAVYVAKYYPPAAEKQMAELIENLRAAYQRITSSVWMDDATRKAALVKLAAFEPRIGHSATYLTAQYDVYESVPGTRIKGSLTLGENIGDLGGIEAALPPGQRVHIW